MEDKVLKFAVLDTDTNTEKVEHQISKSSFDKLDAYPSPKFKGRVNNLLKTWSDNITD